MKFKMLALTLVLAAPLVAQADNGLIKVQSQFDVETTTNRLADILTQKGMTIFARIDHFKAAKQVGVEIQPTQLLIFGNPKVGSPLIACQQSIAIDLPQKALISQDKDNQVWLTYNDPDYLADRHKLTGCEKGLEKVKGALATFAQKATQP